MRPSNEDRPKIGAGHASAWMRQGLRELRQAVYPESNVAHGPVEYGLFGTRTPGEVAEGRRSDALEMEEERQSILGERLQAIGRSPDDRVIDAKELERE